MRLLQILLGRPRDESRRLAFNAPLAPETPFYVIGDIHGCDRLLAQAIARIREHAAGKRPRVVCVGDYIDRGEESRQVLERLRILEAEDELSLICLQGNHEDMLLRFLGSPDDAMWLQNGGLQTLASFGIGLPAGPTAEALGEVRDRLEAAMGPALIAWLRNRPAYWENGNVTVLHAGANPALPIALQSPDTLIWGHPDFRRVPRNDGRWIVHGHTIVDRVRVESGRISVDTGAFATGVLSVVHLSRDGVRILA